MGRLKDLTGQKFGRLTVIERAVDYIQSNGRHRKQWLCKCDCGNQKIVRDENLISKNTQSCGCLQKEIASQQFAKCNKYDLTTHDYGVGYTENREKFLFDLEDYDKIKGYYWGKDKNGYFYTNIYNPKDGTNNKLFIHRLIMNVNNDISWKERIIDHISGKQKRYDNRKSNLRICTIQENVINSSIAKNNTSGVTGVFWNKRLHKWEANICINRERIRLGFFNDFNDAVKARKEAENKYFGEFSYDNSQRKEVV